MQSCFVSTPNTSNTFCFYHFLSPSLFAVRFCLKLETASKNGSFACFRPGSHARGEVTALSRWTSIDLSCLCYPGDSTGLCLRALVTTHTASKAASDHIIWKYCIVMADLSEKKPLWTQNIRCTSLARSRCPGSRLLRCKHWSIGLGH